MAMSDIKEKLRDLLRDKDLARGLMTGSEWQQQHQEVERRREAGDFEIEKVVPGEIIGNEEEGGFYRVRQDFALDTPHGCTKLGEALDVIPEHIAFSSCDEELANFDLHKTVFVDTETTGLAGGTGMTAFLVGAGWFDGDVFRLEQCFMRDFDDEEPMLAYLDELFQRFETVVSYNGKSFDVPLLRTRFVFNRLPYRLDSAMHFDLVHAVRRFWKDRLGNCGLGNVEKAILGIQRHGDVPGCEIPGIWLDYLHTRDAGRLEAVFYHHKMDILSLVALTALLSQYLAIPDGKGFEHAQDRLSLLRVHFRQKRYEDVVSLARQLLDEEEEAPVRRECLGMMALALKRAGDTQQTKEAWEQYMQEFPKDLQARHEVAKLHEHQTRDLERAAGICRETLQLLEVQAELEGGAGVDNDAERAAFQYRLDRILRKIAKASPDAQ